MLLLHHDHHKMDCRAAARRAKAGASGWTRTECLHTATTRVYKTRPVAAEVQWQTLLEQPRNCVSLDRRCALHLGVPGFLLARIPVRRHYSAACRKHPVRGNGHSPPDCVKKLST